MKSMIISAIGGILFLPMPAFGSMSRENLHGTAIRTGSVTISSSAFEGAPKLSPDGTHIAFHRSEGGQTWIVVLNTETNEEFEITDRSVRSDSPDWSPDGTEIVYRTIDEDGAAFVIHSFRDDLSRVVYRNDRGRITGPAWSPDGRHLAFTRILPEETGNPGWGRATLQTLEINGDHRNEISEAGDEWWPRWSPDGQWLVFYTGLTDHLEAIHVESGQRRSISNQQYHGWRPNYSPDGQTVVFVGETEQPGIWVAPVDGSHQPIRISHFGNDSTPSFSPDGRQVVFSANRALRSSHVYDLDIGGPTTRIGHGRRPQYVSQNVVARLVSDRNSMRIEFGELDNRTVQSISLPFDVLSDYSISPDGSMIAAVQGGIPSQRSRIHVVEFAGNLLDFSLGGAHQVSPVWCEGGRYLIYSALSDSQPNFRQIWMLDTETGESNPVTTSQSNKHALRCNENGSVIHYSLTGGSSGIETIFLNDEIWSDPIPHLEQYEYSAPTGGHVAFTERRSGQLDLFIRFTNGQIVQVTNDDLLETDISWDADGSLLFYSSSLPNNDIWTVDVDRLPW
jgi:Tol biopolymer transport system component